MHDRLTRAGFTGFDVYLPGRWAPHCTLSMRVPYQKPADAIRLGMDVLPVETTIMAAAVADHAREQYTPLP